MHSSFQSRGASLCEKISSGRLVVPLSHGHALEAIAIIHNAADWNTLLARKPAPSPVGVLKRCAHKLRANVNAIAGEVTPADLEKAIADALEPGELPPRKARTPAPAAADAAKAVVEPSMDEMLTFLDTNRVRISELLVDQGVGWLGRDAEAECKKIKSLLLPSIHRLRVRLPELPPAEREKAAAAAAALEELPIPEPPKEHVPPSVTGEWHRTVSAKDGTITDYREDRIGMVDYLMTSLHHELRLEHDDYRARLERKSDDDESELVEIRAWLNGEDRAAAVRDPKGLSWIVEPANERLTMWFCFPTITDVSATLKKLRRLTEELPPHSVHVCSTTKAALAILQQQGIGTLHYPTFEMSCRKLRPHRTDFTTRFDNWAPWSGERSPFR